MIHRKTVGIMGILLGLILCAYILGQNYVPPLRDEFAGTFLAGSGSGEISFAVIPQTGEFHYTDQGQGRYIAGEFKEQRDGGFWLICSAAEDSQVIPEQIVTYEDLTVSVQIQENLVEFHKSDNMPIIIGRRE